MRHICQEHRLQTSGVVGTFRLALQLLLLLHHTRYVSYQSEGFLHLSVFIIDRDVVDLVPLYLMTLMEHRTHFSHITHRLREVGVWILKALTQRFRLVDKMRFNLVERHFEFHGSQTLVETYHPFVEEQSEGTHVASLHHVSQLLLVTHDFAVHLLDFQIVPLGLQVHLAFAGHITYCKGDGQEFPLVAIQRVDV